VNTQAATVTEFGAVLIAILALLATFGLALKGSPIPSAIIAIDTGAPLYFFTAHSFSLGVSHGINLIRGQGDEGK
jgi:hypothetical protein